ncbi:MAG: AraC family transcriptional regulator [Eubacteriales bacterium]|nr:AraC family transcriptional regulator [Eubacteriales bacterium]
MPLFNPLKQAKTYRKLILRIVFWFLIIELGFFSLTAIMLFREAENMLIDENQRLMSQTRLSVDNISNQIQTIGLQIMQDPQATLFLYERNAYFEYPQTLQNILANYVKSHSQLIRYIGLYNGYLGTYETSIGELPAGQMGMPVGNSQFSLRPREIKLDGSALDVLNNEFARLVVFYARVDDNPQRTNHGLVVIHLDEQIFLDILEPYRSGIDIYLADSNGIVFASNQPDAFITDLSYTQNFADLFRNSSGTQTLADQGEVRIGNIFDRQLICYQRSASSGLYEIIVVPTSIIWKSYLNIIVPILLIGLLMTFVLVQVIRRLIGHFYKPIQSLILQVVSESADNQDEYQALHQAIVLGDQASRIAREKFLYDLMMGNPNHEDTVRIQQILAQFDSPAFLIIVARFDGFSDLSELNSQDLDSFRFVVINITQELLSTIGPTTGIVTGENEVTLMCQLNEPIIPATLDEQLTAAQTQIRRYFPFTVTVAYHSPVLKFEQFSASYRQTLGLFSYRLFFGPNSILTPEKTIATTKNIRYPIMAEKRILEALNLRREDLLVLGIDDFMQVIGTGYSLRTTNYFSQLLFSVFKQVDNTVELVDEDYDNYIETNSRLIRSDHFDEAKQIITRFCLELMSISQEKTRSATDLKHERLHDELTRYLKDNLADPNLSLESTAVRFSLSTGYLGKLVKASSGDSFTNLLNNFRLEKAADLLINTNQPAYQIAELVGIPNVAYFSTLFKKQYGLSPAPYREKRHVARSLI